MLILILSLLKQSSRILVNNILGDICNQYVFSKTTLLYNLKLNCLFSQSYQYLWSSLALGTMNLTVVSFTKKSTPFILLLNFLHLIVESITPYCSFDIRLEGWPITVFTGSRLHQ